MLSTIYYFMASGLGNVFQSVGGALKNVASTGVSTINKIAGKNVISPIQKTEFTSTIKNPIINKAVTFSATNPVAATAILGSGINAVKYAPTIASAIGAKGVSSTLSSPTAKSVVGGALLFGGGLASGLLSGGSKSQPTQNTNQDITPNQSTTTNATTNSYVDNSQNTNVWNTYKGIKGDVYTGGVTPYSSPTTEIIPSVSNSPSQSAYADANPSQTSSAGNGISWQLIALIGAGIYFLNKN